jgi:hypothetical protein
MLNNDDQQFETRLREFRPLAAEPLPVERSIRARGLRFVLAACAAAIVLAVVAAVIARQRADQFTANQRKVKVVDVVEVHPPATERTLTIRSANELLARAPSVKSALDGLAFQRRARQLPDGTQSALAVLGEEDLKP